MSTPPAPLSEVFDSLGRVLATSSRDWGTYRVDAWLWAVLCGWDCEEQHEHGETCGGSWEAMREMADKHGWSEETVARLRSYRAAVREAERPVSSEETSG